MKQIVRFFQEVGLSKGDARVQTMLGYLGKKWTAIVDCGGETAVLTRHKVP